MSAVSLLFFAPFFSKRLYYYRALTLTRFALFLVSSFSKVWSKVSRNAKSFVRSLLHRDPMKRLTALQALAHPWLSGRDSSTRGSTRQTLSLRLGRNDSSGSASTGNSYRSAASSMRSRRSVRSLVAGQRRVLETQLDVLHQDPEVVGLVGPIAAQQNGSV